MLTFLYLRKQISEFWRIQGGDKKAFDFGMMRVVLQVATFSSFVHPEGTKLERSLCTRFTKGDQNTNYWLLAQTYFSQVNLKEIL